MCSERVGLQSALCASHRTTWLCAYTRQRIHITYSTHNIRASNVSASTKKVKSIRGVVSAANGRSCGCVRVEAKRDASERIQISVRVFHQVPVSAYFVWCVWCFWWSSASSTPVFDVRGGYELWHMHAYTYTKSTHEHTEGESWSVGCLCGISANGGWNLWCLR